MKQVTVDPKLSSFSELQKLINSIGNVPAIYEFSPDHVIEIDVPLTLYNNTEFAINSEEDDSFFKMNLMENAPVKRFTSSTPLITPKYPLAAENICLHNIIFNGRKNYQNGVEAVYPKPWGHGFHNWFVGGKIGNVSYKNSKNFRFYKIKYLGGLGDLIRIEGGTDCYVYEVTALDGGHDVICFVVDGGEIHDCKIDMAVNAAIRTRSGKNIKIYNNEIRGTTKAYSPGIEIQSTASNWVTSDVEVYDNVVSNTYGPAIQIIGQVPNNGKVKVHDNSFSGCGSMPAATDRPVVGAIIHNGIPVEITSNTITDCYGYGIAAGNYDAITTQKSTAVIKGNKISGTKKSLKQGTKSGTAIANLVPALCVIECSDNVLENNVFDLYNVKNVITEQETVSEDQDDEEVYTPVQKTLQNTKNIFSTFYTAYGSSHVQITYLIPASSRKVQLDKIGCALATSKKRYTSTCKVTYQVAGKVETLLKEWPCSKTSYTAFSQALNKEIPAGQDITIRFHLKTSNKAVKSLMKLPYITYTLI